MRISVAFEGSEEPALLHRLARVAEEAGVWRVWVANHLYQRDPVVQATAMLGGTRTLGAALMALSPYAVHPVQIAMTAASLAEHFPGRVALSLGAGAPADMTAAGIERNRPLATLREAMFVTRALLAGECIEHAGERWRLHGRALSHGAQDVPLILAAIGPKMLALAGELADGVVLSAAASLPFIGDSLALTGSRRITRTALVYAAVDDDPAAARDRLRRPLAFVLRGAHHQRNLDLAGSPLDRQAVWDASVAGDWDRAARLIDDRTIANHALVGSPAEIGARLADYAATGLDEIVLAHVGEADHLARLLAAASGDKP